MTDAAPKLSVVIASVNGPPWIFSCLDALQSQDSDAPYEVLVMDRCGEDVRAAIRARFPEPPVIVAACEEGTPIPKLRALGLARARAPLVAVLEDHVSVKRSWRRAALRGYGEGRRVMGGPVENGATRRLVDWAAFYIEYAPFLPPSPPGLVAGSAAVYDGDLLRATLKETGDDVWEMFVHARMKARGEDFHSDPELGVSHDKEFAFGYFVSQRYHYSRSFAAMRLRGAPLWKRAAYAAATPLLVPLVLARLARTVLFKEGHRARFLLALPLVLAFLMSYAWGEAVGALAGPGDSLARVE